MMKVEQSIVFIISNDKPIANYDDLRKLGLQKFDEEFPGFRERHGSSLDIQHMEFLTEPITQFGELRPVAFRCNATFTGLLR